MDFELIQRQKHSLCFAEGVVCDAPCVVSGECWVFGRLSGYLRSGFGILAGQRATSVAEGLSCFLTRSQFQQPTSM
jgi:hypothetical protein